MIHKKRQEKRRDRNITNDEPGQYAMPKARGGSLDEKPEHESLADEFDKESVHPLNVSKSESKMNIVDVRNQTAQLRSVLKALQGSSTKR